MPSEFAALDTSFPDLEGKTTEEKLRSMTDYLYQLLEQLRYTLHNLGTENLNEDSLKDIINMTAKAIDLTGYVTFHSLETPGETVIDGGNIKTGTVTATEIAANTITSAEIAANAIVAGKIAANALNGYNIYGANYWDLNGLMAFRMQPFTGGGTFLMGNNMNFAVRSTEGEGEIETTLHINASTILHNRQTALNLDLKNDVIDAYENWLFHDSVILYNGEYGSYGSSLPGGGTSAPNWSAAEKTVNTGRVFFLI